MGMSFGGGDQYAPLMEALARRRQMQEQSRQPMQQMPALGGTMQSQPVQMPQGYGGASGAASFAGGMPSASSLAELMKQMKNGWGGQQGPSLYERFQGWGSDLGSRIPETQAGVQTYNLSQTPTGGLY